MLFHHLCEIAFRELKVLISSVLGYAYFFIEFLNFLGTFHFLNAPTFPPPPAPLRMACFYKGGFGFIHLFLLQRSRQNLESSDFFFRGADKTSTLRISFFKVRENKFRVRIPGAGGGGGGDCR